jgi:methylmalonyl-CoA/ethylmalonyl-CoA epimerase
MAEINGIDHVGIAVEDLEEAVATFTELLGTDAEVFRIDDGREFDDEGNLQEEWRIAYLDGGNDVLLEFIEPGEVGEGPLGRFVEKHGEGLHHISFWVSPRSEFGTFFEILADMGFATTDPNPRRSDPEASMDNKFTYVHPKDAHGVLIELITPYRMEDDQMKPVESAEDGGVY